MACASIIPSGKKRSDIIATEDHASLYRHVVPYITDWEGLGPELGLKPRHLECISRDNAYNPNRTKDCCKAVLKKWLQLECSPSWGVIEDAVNAIEMKPLDRTTKDNTHNTKYSSMAVLMKEMQLEDPLNTDKDFTGTGKTSGIQFSGHLKVLYINTHHTTGKDDWPPDQPKHFTTLVLLQQKHQPTQECVIALEEESASGYFVEATIKNDDYSVYPYYQRPPKILQEHLKQCKVTKNIYDILNILEHPDVNPRTILIEGAPGIGKTFLLKHIAFEWANNNLLKSSQLVFLLCLRDPAVQQLSSINDLVLYFYKYAQDKTAIIAFCSYLLNSNGKSVSFLIDGFDELPEKLKEGSFVVSIINHEVLPASGVVITSRPHATAHLHDNVAGLITIMGFAEEDRREYVKETLKGRSNEMLDYLNTHSTIDNLCYIPFNLTVLIFLYKRGFTLPKNATQLYDYFICLTIRRYLSKHQIKQRFKNLNDLADPYSSIIDQLAALSYTAVGKQQITFTLEEIKSACPDIDTIPEGINGLGLLQAVQHFGFIEETMTVNFLHLSLQEYLAAYHVAHLSANEELLALHDYFFDYKYKNTFLFYLGLTKGQHPAFKYFLSGGGRYFGTTSKLLNKLFSNHQNKAKISSGFFYSFETILPLFRCFYEAGDKGWCDAIVDCNYNNGEFYHCSVGIKDTEEEENISLLLSHRQEWCLVEFMYEWVPNMFLKTLHQVLVVHMPVISTIHLTGITPPLDISKGRYIAEIVISCKTRVLKVQENKLNSSEWMIQMLSHKSCMLEELDAGSNGISSTTTCELLSYMKNTKALRLKSLNLIEHNPFDDKIANEIDACVMLERVHLSLNTLPTITLFSSINISKYSRLKTLYIDGDFTDDKAAYEIATCFQQNCTLTTLQLDNIIVSDEACLQMINALQDNTTLQDLHFRVECSKCLVNKIKSRISIINQKRHLIDKYLPKFLCYESEYCKTNGLSSLTIHTLCRSS